MVSRTRVIVATLWVLSLLAVAEIVRAQGGVGRMNWPKPEVPRTQIIAEPPVTLSGNDIGFRVDRNGPNGPIGRLVIRVNGQWIEPVSK